MARATEFLGANCLNVRDLQEFEDQSFTSHVTSVEARNIGDKQKLVVYFEGVTKGLALNQENLQSMLELAGGEDDTDRWTGLEVTVYLDANVAYMGRRVGGIRIKEPEQPAKGKAGK